MTRLASGVLSVFRSQKQAFNGSLLTPSILAYLSKKHGYRCNSLPIVTLLNFEVLIKLTIMLFSRLLSPKYWQLGLPPLGKLPKEEQNAIL